MWYHNLNQLYFAGNRAARLKTCDTKMIFFSITITFFTHLLFCFIALVYLGSGKYDI